MINCFILCVNDDYFFHISSNYVLPFVSIDAIFVHLSIACDVNNTSPLLMMSTSDNLLFLMVLSTSPWLMMYFSTLI